VDPARERFLDELFEFGRDYDAALDDRRERLRNVDVETARMLAVLVQASGARRVLELGSSNGYSTLWLADAVGSAGGRITTVELDRGRAHMAQENFTHAGLANRIDLRLDDAAVIVAESHDDTWEFIFLDAERDQYVSYWPDLVRILAPRGLLAVDNVCSHADELIDFKALVENHPRITSAVVPIGAGLLLATKGT